MKRIIYIKPNDLDKTRLLVLLRLYPYIEYFTHMEIRGCYYGIDIPILKRYIITMKHQLDNGKWDIMLLVYDFRSDNTTFKMVSRKIYSSFNGVSPFYFPWFLRKLRFCKITYDTECVYDKEVYLHVDGPFFGNGVERKLK